MIRLILFAVLFVLTAALPLQAAQSKDRDEAPVRWGVNVSLPASWEFAYGLKPISKPDQIVLKGSEFQIGFIRGRELGGDWGVSLVRKKIFDSMLAVGETKEDCWSGYDGTGFIRRCYRYGDSACLRRPR
ncbi:MAG: hypothetical protein Q8R34_02540 [bacterium]|nr:hypothetical protein [bacterium]